jgi:glycosyltransferase involved in cell wall biosynthesis
MGQWSYHKPIVVTVHGSDIFQVTRHPVGAAVTRSILSRAVRVTAVSDALKQATSAIGINPGRIEVISNGIDLQRFRPPQPDLRSDADQEKIVLFAGFLIKRKGVCYLLDAISLLPSHLRPYRVVIVGDGPEEGALHEQARALGLEKRVEFVGFQPQSVVSEWMKRAWIFVLPSLEEGQGVVLLEALASATPVVASDVDGIREVVVPEVGTRVPPADSAALASAIERMLVDKDAWQRMSQAARQRAVEVYDWDTIGAQFVDLYKRTL